MEASHDGGDVYMIQRDTYNLWTTCSAGLNQTMHTALIATTSRTLSISPNSWGETNECEMPQIETFTYAKIWQVIEIPNPLLLLIILPLSLDMLFTSWISA